MLNEIFKNVRTILVIDWPNKDLPETLAMAGFNVVVRGGPGPADFVVYELDNGEVKKRLLGKRPDSADLIYSYRPLSELSQIIDTAKDLHASTIWSQSGVSEAGVNDPKGCWLPEEDLHDARRRVESAGLKFVTQPYICDIAGRVQAQGQQPENFPSRSHL